MKALMPILVTLIGFKAMKALILSKIAITLVLGFIILQLVKKAGMKMPMSMNPMPAMPSPQPGSEYGAPIPSASPLSSYDSSSSSWEASNGQYSSRVWEPSSAASSHNLAYNGYYGPGSYASPTYTSNSYASQEPTGSASTSSITSSSAASKPNSGANSAAAKAY